MSQKSLKPRYVTDPLLSRIDKVVPDDFINDRFYIRRVGKRPKLLPSQLYRVHLLAVLKSVNSFNAICKELQYHRGLRKFCHISKIPEVPVKRSLSEFRSRLGPEGFEEIFTFVLKRLLDLIELPSVIVICPDSTDIEATCRDKKKF